MNTDTPFRGQTEKLVTQTKGATAGVICGAVCLLLQGVAIGVWWLVTAESVIAPYGITNATNTNVTIFKTAIEANAASWSKYYHITGILTLVAGALSACGLCLVAFVGCNEHVIKAKVYHGQGREEEAAEEEGEEGAIVKCAAISSQLGHCITSCVQFALCLWFWVGCLMICFGASALGGVQKGFNDASKWWIIINVVAYITLCCALSCFCFASVAGLVGGMASSGSMDESESE